MPAEVQVERLRSAAICKWNFQLLLKIKLRLTCAACAGIHLCGTEKLSRGAHEPSTIFREQAPIFFVLAFGPNPTWGAPRIHGELLKLGFALSEATVSRWIQRAPRTPGATQGWLTFLRNHREAIAAAGCTTVTLWQRKS
jgi:hypothetical protein